MSESVPTFISSEWLRLRGHGWGAVVACDKKRDRDDPGLRGNVIAIDGELFLCMGVERYMPRGPIKEGEKIVLLVREIAEQNQGEGG